MGDDERHECVHPAATNTRAHALIGGAKALCPIGPSSYCVARIYNAISMPLMCIDDNEYILRISADVSGL